MNFSRALVEISQSNSSAIVNEIFDSMVEFSHKENGLVELKLTQLPSEAQLDLEFDHDLLQRLVTKT